MALGYALTQQFGTRLARALLAPWLLGSTLTPASAKYGIGAMPMYQGAG